MGAPWEKYSALNAPQAGDPSGPWTKYQSTQSPGMNDSPVVEQEMPDDVSAYDRAIVKNLSNSPEASVKYLQEKYPQYKVSHDDGNILFQKPGDSTMKVLDPNQPWAQRLSHPLSALKEGAMDLGDVAYDIPAGLASGVAATTAGLSALPETLGIGSLPAASAAGGATSAGLEALRQKLGQYFGIPQDINKKDVAISGVGGAVAPLLFGTGASDAAVAKEALDRGLNPAATSAFEDSQRGLISRAFPKVASVASGIPSKTIDTANENLGEIKNLEGSKDAASRLASSVQGDVSKVASVKRETGKAIEDALSASDKEIPLDGAKAPYLDRIAKLQDMQSRGIDTPAVRDELSALNDDYKSIFKTAPIESKTATSVGPYGEEISKTIPGASEKEIEALSPSDAFDLKKRLGDMASIQKTGSKGIGIARNAGADLTDRIRQDVAAEARKNVGASLEQAVPETADLNDKYESVSKLLKSLGPSVKTKDKAYNLVKSLTSGNKEVLGEDLAKADADYGTNFVDKANLIDAFNTFRKTKPIELGWKTITQRAPAEALGGATGAYLGYESGGGYKSGLAGGLAGAGLGAAGASPTALRLMMSAGNAAPAAQKMTPALWNLLQSRMEQN